MNRSYGDCGEKSEERRTLFLPVIIGSSVGRREGEAGLDVEVGAKEGEGKVARDHKSLVLFVFSPSEA